MQREMTETGKVSTFTTNVVNASGEENQQEVTRIGAFNVVSEGNTWSLFLKPDVWLSCNVNHPAVTPAVLAT